MLWHILKTAGFAVFLSLLVCVLIGLALPTQLRVEIDRNTKSPAECLFRNVARLDQWPQWSIWSVQDPETTYRYEGKPGELGSKQYWQSSKHGKGSITLVDATEFKEVLYDLQLEDWNYTVKGMIRILGQSDLQTLTWTVQSKPTGNPLYRWGNLLFAPMVEEDLRQSLDRLEKVCSPSGE